MQDAEHGKNDLTEIYLKIYLIQTDLDMDPKINLCRTIKIIMLKPIMKY
jgi:hypothetical protein